MFRKGHKGMGGGRKRGSSARRNLTSENTTGRKHSGKARGNNKNGAVDSFPVTKKWDTSTRRKLLDSELVDYYINNDLDVTELFDSLKDYKTEEEKREQKQKWNRENGRK